MTSYTEVMPGHKSVIRQMKSADSPEVGFREIASDLRQARFWIAPESFHKMLERGTLGSGLE
jgi:hypothetical protein